MTASAPTAPTAPGVRSWWGIPFATAERYRRPVVAVFDPDRPYDRKGVAPVQPDTGDWLEADSGTGEDCLNLNVWAPAQPAGTALPVAVYVHGGGFEFGANTQITSNAAGLAASGRVVSVSVNYRLGALGAVSLSQYRFDPHTVDRITDEVAGRTTRFAPLELLQPPRRPETR
jgi:para-nitrobenzyl esterase